MNEIDWSAAPEGAAGALITKPGNIRHPGVIFAAECRHSGGTFYGVACGGGHISAPDDCWEWIERSAPWAGEGLPPVGAECEFAPRYTSSGIRVLVIAHDEGSAVGRYLSGNCLGSYTSFEVGELVPLRTPEQIAAEERLHKIRNACTDIADTLDGLRGKNKVERAALAVIEAMIDAGYHKVAP